MNCLSLQGFGRGRRLSLSAVGVFALVAAWPAIGQVPRFSAAQSAARDWLALADADDAVGTYANASEKFKQAMAGDQWALAMKRARDQFGAVQRRTVVRTGSPAPGPDVPPGEFVVIQYRSEFAKRPQGTETVTLEREADGKWRVVGYLMQ
jgi:hypothetical protein